MDSPAAGRIPRPSVRQLTVERTLLFFAMPGEAAPFLQRMRQAQWEFRSQPVPILAIGARRFVAGELEIWVTGVGLENASRNSRIAIGSHRPKRVLTAGVAGALDPRHQIGEVFHDADPDSGLDALLCRAGSRAGRITMQDRVAITAAEKARLHRETGADLVEMESMAIRIAAREAGVPSATVRSVSDDARGDLPLDFNEVYTREMRLSAVRLAMAIASRPWKIPALIRLGGNTRKATETLAQVLAAIVLAR